MHGRFLPRVLGRTGLAVGPLGLSSSYGLPARALEMAFERGMNYLYWGSLRRESFAQGLRNLRPQRNKMVLVVQSYSRLGSLTRWSVEKALRRIGFDYADVLLLGYWNSPVSPRILDAARELQRTGKVRFLSISTHDNQFLGAWAAASPVDIFQLRYNAVDRSAEQHVFPNVQAQEPPGMVAYTATCWKRLLQQGMSAPGDPVPMAGDCYRFVLSNPNIHICMTGTADEEQTRHALDAIDRGPMSPDELAWMRRTGDAINGRPRLLPLSVR